MKLQILTVSEITHFIKNKLEGDDFLAYVGVRGEISNFKHHTSGHMYFTLKDNKSTLRCVMFRRENRKLKFSPQDGIEVVALGSIGVYARDGLYQLYVEAMEPAGLGFLHLTFEELKARLEKEGLFAPERKRPLPLLPRKVGVITSITGAAIRDIITVSRRRFPNIDLVVAPVLVQGERAAPQMVAALDALSQVPGIDVIILGRGGGSWEELWPFNDEALVRAVAACPVPVISAVGHETDFTLVDFVADVRAPTPSAAAELAVPDQAQLKNWLESIQERSLRSIKKIIDQGRQTLENLAKRRPLSSFRFYSDDRRQLLDSITRDLERAMTGRLQVWQNRLSLNVGRLDSLSPLAVMERGYSLVFTEEGQILRSADQAAVGMRVRVQLARGQLWCRVETVEGGNPNGC